ncbi:MAG TPA: CvpA family protein [Methylomirabilota bacterium]|nr:CvpA family protein [Methylomirabilota bacterium]
MTALDWGLVAVGVGIALAGFWKGAVRLVFGLGGVALGVWLAVVAGEGLGDVLTGVLGDGWLALGLGYVLPVVVVAGLCQLAGWGLERTLEQAKLGWVNRLVGCALSGAAAAVVLSLLLLTAVALSPEVARYEEDSLLLETARRAMGRAAPAQPAAAPAEAEDGGGDDAGSPSGR